MIDTFQDALANIRSQQSVFENLDERAVEIGVVLPLLRRVGWNTENVSEVYPQRGLEDGNKVDYDLQIDGESRILIEVKRWIYTLNEHEDQLARYCRLTKPSLAILTNGHNWRLYFTTKKLGHLRSFLDIDITVVDPAEAESVFRRFLAKDRMSDVKPTLAEARKLHRESQAFQEFDRALSEALGDLDNDGMARLFLNFAESQGIPANEHNVKRFLKSHDGIVVNPVRKGAAKSRKKPASFRLYASPTGDKKGKPLKVSGKPGWNKLLLRVCGLMNKRHPENFRETILSMSDRFADVKDSEFDTPVGDTGIFAKWGGSVEIREACYEIVARFGYPRGSLEIRDSSGIVLEPI